MANEKHTFTKASLTALSPPPEGRAYYRDEIARCLILDVQSSGTKTFRINRKINGVPKKITLGKFNPSMPDSRDFPNSTDPLTLVGNAGELNIKMARKLAAAVNASIDRGVDPAQQARHSRQLISQELTLRQAFDAYYKDHLVPHGKKTAEDLKNDFARYLGVVEPGQKKLRAKRRQNRLVPSTGKLASSLRFLKRISVRCKSAYGMV